MRHSIVLATSNSGKIREIKDLLAFADCIPQHKLGISDAIENAQTFVENALIKARHASSSSSLPALADDSGLVVPVLQGKPGIYSSRYAGITASSSENITLLLHEMKDIPPEERHAYFYCSLVFVRFRDDPMPIICNAMWSGTIAQSPLGSEGFGYDPIFFVDDFQCTAAQLPATIKNTLSHRAKALQIMRECLAHEFA